LGIIILIIFVFCAAMAVGSILLASRLMAEYRLPFLRPLFYYIIFMAAFGFYGVWGQFIIIAITGEKLTPELLSTISVISLLLGLPFLVIGWMMMIRFGFEFAGTRFTTLPTVFFLVFNFGLIALLGIVSGDLDFSEALPLFKYYYTCVAVISGIIAAVPLMGDKSCRAVIADRRFLAFVMPVGTLLQAAVLLLLPHSAWMALTFVFLLFASMVMLPVYLSYIADLKVLIRPDEMDLPMGIEEFFVRHEISPREADIIKEICNGLSNQEIADKLFITLQTVKDHTSRIYTKTNVRNRMQLMTLVRSFENS
jgi:DNA-binding CsgD family transcriptional regulator